MEQQNSKTQVLRVCTYSRVSTAHREQKPEVQIEELRRYCAARGWVIAHEIVDHGYSGGTDSRPGLKRLMELVRSREVDGLVVVKLDRLFRSLKHLVTVLEELQALKVLFIATKDNVDYSTPGGRLFVQVLGSLSEFERALVKERTLMGLAHARSMGKRLGRPPKAQEGDIRRLRAQGASYRAIRKALGCGMGSIRRALKGAPKTLSNDPAEVSENTGGESA